MADVLFYIGPLSLTVLRLLSRFCALKIQDNGISYMPSLNDCQDTTGVLYTGFIESHSCDANIIVGDFNIDFSRISTSANYLWVHLIQWVVILHDMPLLGHYFDKLCCYLSCTIF